MAGRLVLVACLVALFGATWAAKSHTVGDATGWTNTAGPTFYTTWAAGQTFSVGDSLVFNFPTGGHTVEEVSKSDYDSCSSSNPISTATNGPATLKITTAGTHYYICSFPGHCTAGQKLAITTSTSSTPAPVPSSSRRSSPPPSGAATSPASSSTAPAPSSSTSSPSPSGSVAASPSSSTPSASGGSGTNTVAPPPSSANVVGAGIVLPFVLVAAALLF